MAQSAVVVSAQYTSQEWHSEVDRSMQPILFAWNA